MSIDPAPAQTVIAKLDPCGLIAVETWIAAPDVILTLAGSWRSTRVEPTVWWLRGPLDALDDTLARLTSALANDGAITDLSGGFDRLRISGPAWRSALMFGGVFDAEDPAFRPGSVAGTILHHMAVRYDVIDDHTVEIFVPPSYAADLLNHLRAAISRL